MGSFDWIFDWGVLHLEEDVVEVGVSQHAGLGRVTGAEHVHAGERDLLYALVLHRHLGRRERKEREMRRSKEEVSKRGDVM